MSVIALLVLAAAPWEATFEPSSTTSYLDRPNAAVVVVSGGETSASSQAAAAAIVKALRAGRNTRLVMTGESVSVQPTDSDSAIVKRASVLPVDLVLVVRLFPGATETVVATLYDKAGAAVSAMAGTDGQPLPRKEGQLATTAGRDAVVAAVKTAGVDDRVDAAFDDGDEHITFRKRDPEVAVFKRRALEGARFYQVVGEPTLADQYNGRVAAKVSTIVGGSLLLLTGAGFFVFGDRRCAVLDAASYTCIQTRGPDPLATSLILGGIGLGSLIFGIAFSSDPVGIEKRRELVKRHNDKLDAPPQSQASPVSDVRVSVAPTPGGAFGALSFRF